MLFRTSVVASLAGCSAFSYSGRACVQKDSPTLIDFSLGANWQEVSQNKWGPADRLGAINYITPQKVLEASSLISQGKTYGTALLSAPETPAFGDRHFMMNASFNEIGGATGLGYHEDVTDASVGVGTHIDGLGHISIDGHFYNGLSADTLAASDVSGIKALSASTIPPIVTRAVVLDIAGYKGVSMMGPSEVIYPADLVGAARKQGVCFGLGDVLLLRTGWMNKWLEEADRSYGDSNPGIGVEAAQYLAELGIVAVGADTWAVEAFPGEEGMGAFQPHQILLPKYGVYIIENVHLEDPVRDGVSEAFFSLGVPMLGGSVQTNVNPVLIV